MTMSELLWRSMLGAAVVGVPGYALGTLIYSGKTLPRWLLGTVGGASGLLLGMVAFSVVAPPWAPVVFASIITAFVGAATLLWAPKGQARVREILARRRWRAGPRS